MLWSEIKAQYKTAGWKAVMIYVAIRVIDRLCYFEVLHTMSLQTKDVDPKYLNDPESGLQGRFLSKAEVLAFAQNPKYQLTADYLSRSLENDDQCFAFVDNGVLAAYGWYSTKPTRVTGEFQVHFPDSWVYMHHGYTNPDYRGQRLHAIGMAQAARNFEQRGFHGLVSIVAGDNANSLKSVKRLGYRLTGRIYLFGRFNRYLVYPNAGAMQAKMGLTALREDITAMYWGPSVEQRESA